MTKEQKNEVNQAIAHIDAAMAILEYVGHQLYTECTREARLDREYLGRCYEDLLRVAGLLETI